MKQVSGRQVDWPPSGGVALTLLADHGGKGVNLLQGASNRFVGLT